MSTSRPASVLVINPWTFPGKMIDQRPLATDPLEFPVSNGDLSIGPLPLIHDGGFLCADDEVLIPSIGFGFVCERFDFTILFEEIFFTAVPCTLALIAASHRLRQLWGRPKVIQWPFLLITKLVCQLA
jgi:hypothetical protein